VTVRRSSCGTAREARIRSQGALLDRHLDSRLNLGQLLFGQLDVQREALQLTGERTDRAPVQSESRTPFLQA